MPKVTAYSKHKSKWTTCTLCPLAKKRKHVVLARGKLPCDVLFIGEAPGASEDVLGQPFVGPAGKLLDKMIEDALGVKEGVKIAFTNLIACVPKAEIGSAIEEPPEDSIKACRERLDDFLSLAMPRFIVAVGNHAKKHAPAYELSIPHPAFILRLDSMDRYVMIRRTVSDLSYLFQTLKLPPSTDDIPF